MGEVNEIVSSLEKPVSKAFTALPREEKHKRVLKSGISLTAPSLETQLAAKEQAEGLSELGLTVISPNHVIAGMALIAEGNQLTIPYPEVFGRKKKEIPPQVKQRQGEFFDDLIGRINLEKMDDSVHIYELRKKEEGEVEKVDITEKVKELLTLPEGLKKLEEWKKYGNARERSGRHLQQFVKTNEGLVVVADFPRQIQTGGPTIILKGEETVHASEPLSKFTILRAMIRNEQLKTQRERLASQLAQGEIKTYEAFDMVKRWPKNPVMEHLRDQVRPLIESEIKRRNLLCDHNDAMFQVLFRLTTFSPAELFTNGEHLVENLRKKGVTSNWQIIPELERDFIQDFQVNPERIQGIIAEQLLIIENRLRHCSLPLKDILSQTGVFDGNWQLRRDEKDKTKLFAVGPKREKIQVRFDKVKPEIATLFHSYLHYIHTPRTDVAYGLYLEGQDLPFSVEAIEMVGRDYKKNTLLLFGFNPDKVIELTRLYNWPGSPLSTTSIMDRLVFDLFRKEFPEIQAAMTSIMPTYTLSKSQIAGGMKDVVLIKPGKHIFRERIIEGKPVYEHVTNRRREREDLTGTSPQQEIYNHEDFPLLPVVYLVQPLSKPQFNPLLPLGEKMVEVEV